MKKVLAIALSLVLIATVFSGCAKAKDAATEAVSDAIAAADDSTAEVVTEAADLAETAEESGSDSDTASAFYSAYVESKSIVLGKITDGLTNNPDTLMTAMSFLGATLSDLYLLPAMYFGLGESSVSTALAMMGAKDVIYDEQGNTYTVTYQNSDEQEVKLTGTYEKGKSLVCVGTTAGVENVFSEVYRTAFGYVGQFYGVSDDGTSTLYQFAINGEDGVVGLSSSAERPSALSGSESADFAKSAKEWFAINGSTITGVDAEGKSISFEYVPSESSDGNG